MILLILHRMLYTDYFFLFVWYNNMCSGFPAVWKFWSTIEPFKQIKKCFTAAWLCFITQASPGATISSLCSWLTSVWLQEREGRPACTAGEVSGGIRALKIHQHIWTQPHNCHIAGFKYQSFLKPHKSTQKSVME